MDYNFYRPEQDFPIGVKKIEIWKKLFYAIFISVLTYSINFGDPKTNSIARHFQITDQKIQYIFETTIAIETKTVRQRISEQSSGVWTMINGLILGSNWADIEVQLKTRIGIKLNSITYDRLTNNVHVNFGDPCILDRTLKTRTLKTSDNFFKWSIEQYQKYKQKFEEEILDIQSQQLIKYYQTNNQKIQQLQNQYYGKIMQALQQDTKEFSVQFNIVRLNQLVLSCVTKFMPQIYFTTFKKAYQYQRPIKPYQAIQSIRAQPSNYSKANLSQIGYLKQQAILNEQMQIINNPIEIEKQVQIILSEPLQEQILQEPLKQQIKDVKHDDIIINKSSRKSIKQRIIRKSNPNRTR